MEEFIFSEGPSLVQQYIHSIIHEDTKQHIASLVKKFRNKRSYRCTRQHLVSVLNIMLLYMTGLVDFCAGRLPSHGELLNLLREEKFQILCLQQVRGIASSLVPTDQEESIMRNRVQAQLSLQGNEGVSEGPSRTTRSFIQLRDSPSCLKPTLGLRPTYKNTAENSKLFVYLFPSVLSSCLAFILMKI